MVGGDKDKPREDEKFPMGPGVHCVTIDDVITGVSDKTGAQYWIVKMLNDNDVQFDHFIACEETKFKSLEKVFKAAARQMEALLIYDQIGEQPDHTAWFQKAIDCTYALKGKKVEFTIKTWEMDGKKGVWGEITGYLDIPNAAIQTVPKGEDVEKQNEEIPF